MSRGRKPQMGNNNSSSDYVFKKNVGSYIQAIAIALASEQEYQCDDASELLNHVRSLNKKKYPSIRDMDAPFILPKNWVWGRLGEICDYGSSPKAEPKELKSDTWVLDLEDIEKDTSILLHKIRFSARNSLSTKSVFKKGEVLYSKLRPYLDKVIVADEDGVCTTEILPLKIFGNINPHFLRLALKCPYFLSYVNGVTKGMKMPRLGTKEGQNAVIPLPPISEQDMIVAFVNDFEANRLKSRGNYFNATVEQKIIELHNSQLMGLDISSELTNQLTLLKKLRQQLLQDAVQGKLVPHDKNDESASELLKKIKAEKAKNKKYKELPAIKPEEIPFDIPDNWVWCRGEIVANYIDPQPSHRTPPANKNGIPYIAMSDINKDGSIDFNSARKVGFEILEEHRNRYELCEGDFIFGKIGTIGKPVILPKPFDYTLSANVILIQPNRSLINEDYLFYFLSSPAAERNLRDNKSTTSYPVFGMGKARNMPIPLPPLCEQNRIVAALLAHLQTCDDLEANIKISKGQNEQLLQQVLREALANRTN